MAFLPVGLILYAGAYALSTGTHRNCVLAVKTALRTTYDYVILGASHATVFDFDAMNTRLERMTGARIINLSVVGGGITVNRLLLPEPPSGGRQPLRP